MLAVPDHGTPIDAATDDRANRRVVYLEYTAIGTVIVLAMMLLVHLMLLRIWAGYRTHHTCVICRLNRTNIRWDINWPYRQSGSGIKATTCSTWYQSHVEPSREHVWAKGSSIAILNFYGDVIGMGDNLDRPGRAVWQLSPDQQIKIYQRFDDPMKAKQIFISSMDHTLVESRMDYAIVYSLKEWLESDLAQPWKNPAQAQLMH